MQEKHNKPKETDVTWVLVVIFIGLLAVLLVTVSNRFLQIKPSASSRAASPKAAASLEQSKWCQNNKPLNGVLSGDLLKKYDSSKDFCTLLAMQSCELNTGKDVFARDYTNSYSSTANSDPHKCGYGMDSGIYQCCRNSVKLSGTSTIALGNNLCIQNTGDSRAICVMGTDTERQTKCTSALGQGAKLSSKCAVTANNALTVNTLYEGNCCSVPVSTSQTDCGKQRLNCDRFNAPVATNNDLLKNTNKAGQMVTTKCMATADGDAFCVNNAVANINGSIQCDGSQFRDNYYGQTGCFTTTSGTPAISGNNFYCIYSEMKLTAEQISSGVKCKDLIRR